MTRPSVVLLLVLLLPAPGVGADSLTVECVEGCLPRGEDPTLDLLLRSDPGSPLTLRWSSPENPAAPGETLTLYAGNPLLQDAIPDRGALRFSLEGDRWSASFRATPEQLGSGTFLAIVVRKKGGDEEILDWRAFRLLTPGEQEQSREDAEPAGAWSLDVRPSVLQATSGRGELPRSVRSEDRVWWSLSRVGGETSDLDLDGETNGIPGLGVQVSTPWEAGVGQTDWKQKVLDRLTGVQGHTVRFEDLQWVEAPERKLEGGLKLAHYYTMVTLYTNASVRSFDKKEVGGGGLFTDPTYFSHETSARLKHTRDVRFWASYSRREYGADRHLLELLRRQASKSGSVPGLGLVQTDDGDGGSIVYRVGFVARARPWETPAAGQPQMAAGFVGVDVVAARAGVGGVTTQGTAGLGDLQKAWCQVVRCGGTSHTLDLDEPPPGYEVAQPVASLSTLSGGIALSEGKPLVGQREVPPVGETPAPRLPHLTRFALAANLRAGALLRKGSLGHTRQPRTRQHLRAVRPEGHPGDGTRDADGHERRGRHAHGQPTERGHRRSSPHRPPRVDQAAHHGRRDHGLPRRRLRPAAAGPGPARAGERSHQAAEGSMTATWAAAAFFLASPPSPQEPAAPVARQLELHQLRLRALALYDAGSFREALPLYTRIAVEAHALPRFPGAAPHSWQSLYNQNVRDLEAAGQEGMGNSLVGIGEFEQALPQYEKALALYPSGEDPMMGATLHSRLGFALHQMLERERALREYRVALTSAKDAAAVLADELRSSASGGSELMKHANDAVTLRQLYLNATAVLVSLGRFEEAIEAFHQRELVDLQRALQDPAVLAGLGAVGPLIQHSNTLVEGFLLNGEGACLNELADETGLLEHRERAITLLKKATDTARTLPGEKAVLPTALSNLGSAYQSLGRSGEAVRAYRQAVAVARQPPGEPYSELAAWNNLADLFLEAGDLAGAREAIKSLGEALAHVPSDPEMTWRLESLRGRLFEAEGRFEDAAARFEKAIDLVEAERAAISIPKLKETFFRTRQRPYEYLARVLGRLGRHEDALFVMEKVRARSLADSLSGLRVVRGVSPALKTRETDALAAQRALLVARNRVAAPGADPQASVKLSVQEERARNAGRTYLEILAGAPEYADVKGADPLKPREVAALLDPDTVLLTYLLGERTAMVGVLRPNGEAVTKPLPTAPSELQKLASEFAGLVRGAGGGRGAAPLGGAPRPWRPASEALFRALVAPVWEHVAGAKRLAVVPYGALNYVPFGALARPGGGLLIESHEIAVLPSATVLKYCRARAGKGRARAVVFALGRTQPKAGRGWTPLPWTVQEGRSVQEILPDARLVQEAEFTRESVVRLAPSYDIVHFATHGLLDGGDPLRSAVITADEPLRVEDIFELRLNASLVVLSACESGLGRIFRGDEIVGLTRAFFYAGTPSVLATLWSVDDESTARFMAGFYRALQRPGTSKSSALRQAQLELMKQYDRPYHWAPFELWGDWR